MTLATLAGVESAQTRKPGILEEADLKAAAERLAQARADYEAVRAESAGLLAAFRAEHADTLHDVEVLKGRAEQAEQAARELAVAWFAATGEKRAGYGLAVQLRDSVVIEDPAAALAWCLVHAPICVALEPRAVATIAKGIPIPGVRLVRAPVATIASDMAKALATAALEAAITEHAEHEEGIGS